MLYSVPDVKSPFPINYHPCVQYITVCRVTNTGRIEKKEEVLSSDRGRMMMMAGERECRIKRV